MVALNIAERPHQSPDLTATRATLAAAIGTHPLMRQLPALADLPLELIDASGAPCRLEACLQQHTRVTLAGCSGSGRQLVLLQYLMRRANASPTGPAPLLINLSRLDDGTSAPSTLLAAQLATIVIPNPPPPSTGRFSFWRAQPAPPTDAAPPAARVMLLQGLDELPAARRDAWRAALQQFATTDSTTQLAVAVPEGEATWPGYAPLFLISPTVTEITAWIEHLAPEQHRQALNALLAPQNAFQPLGQRLFEVALLAWLAAPTALPRTRAELYAQALAQVLGLNISELDTAPVVTQLQLLAAYDETMASPPAALIETTSADQLRFHHPQIRRYLAARQLAAEQRIDLLALVEPAEQRELALLLTTMLHDPDPLYAQLWEQAHNDTEYILLLGNCLAERAPDNSVWTLRIVGGLAQMVRSAPDADSAYAAALLEASAPAFDTAVEATLGAGETAIRSLMRLFDLLPREFASKRMLQLVLHNATPTDFGWQLTDRLLEEPGLRLPISAPIPANDPMLARWICLHALHSGEQRAMLDPALARTALLALQATGDAFRTMMVATAFLGDERLAPALRASSIEVLGNSEQTGTIAALERAADSPDPQLRQAALTALNQSDSAHATITWGHTAVDHSADLTMRLTAIENLGSNITYGVAHQLAQCVLDSSLPLVAQLRAIEQLKRNETGCAELLGILNRNDVSEALRAAAAQALGSADYITALRDMIRLLDAPPAAYTLIEGCCDGLGKLGNAEATEPLLALLERSYHDPQITRAAIHALGQIGDVHACEPLGALLGAGALQRLQRHLTPRLLQLPIEHCRDNSAIPPRLIEHIAATLASAISPEAQPTTLGEFLAGEADQVRTTAAQALAAIGGNSARAALLAAVIDDTAGGATADLISALAEIDGADNLDVFTYLLESAEISPMTRWLVVQQLTTHPNSEPLMTNALMNTSLDAFTRGALAEGLGQRHALSALPLLRTLAEDASGDAHLRAQAILGLGLLNDTTTETILLRIVGDTTEDSTLRGLAADYLPTELSAEGRRALRELLRNDRPPVPLLIGILRTLGRTHDHESLQLVLRYSEDANSLIAQAAIDALADLGDSSATPKLVQISQQPAGDHALRLQAVGALLRLGGAEYRQLLRSYLQQGALPFRLLALEALISADTPATELSALLAERSWPVPLRLRLMEYLAGDIAAAPLLTEILHTNDDEPQIRAHAAEALGRMHWQAATPVLTEIALDTQGALPIRLRCITALRQLNSLPNWLVIGQLADDERQPSVVRNTAWHALSA